MKRPFPKAGRGFAGRKPLTPAEIWDDRVTHVMTRCAADYPTLTRAEVEKQLTAMYGPRPADKE